MVAAGRIAIIPARGGSKRIPRKNTVDFRGRPMIFWTIAAAIEANLFDRIVVSTDDPEIASVARDCGAEAPFLRDKGTDDLTPVSAATLRGLEQAEQHYSERYGMVCQLMPNCPLRTGADIIAAYEQFAQSGASFQISCFRFGWMNPWWAVRLDDRGRPERFFPEVVDKRSQDLEELYCPSGAIWWAEVEAFKKAETFFGPDHKFQPMDWKSAVDIDDADDLAMAVAVAAMAGRP